MLHSRILVLAPLFYLACGSTFELNLSRKSSHGVRPGAKRNGRNKRSTVDESNNYFVTDVAIGTPPQRFSLEVRLDAAALSVPDKSCIYLPEDSCPSYCKASLFCKALCKSVCCDGATLPPSDPSCETEARISDCGNRRRFDRSQSSTYQLCTDCAWGCDGGGRIQQVFFKGFDTIRMNDGNGKELAIQKATFGEI